MNMRRTAVKHTTYNLVAILHCNTIGFKEL